MRNSVELEGGSLARSVDRPKAKGRITEETREDFLIGKVLQLHLEDTRPHLNILK